MSIHNNPALILDNGSGYLKCGMSNNQFPDFSLPALVGRPMLRYEENVEGIQIKVSDNLLIPITIYFSFVLI